MGTLYYDGYDVERNKEKAIKLWKESSDKGVPYSTFMLYNKEKIGTKVSSIKIEKK